MKLPFTTKIRHIITLPFDLILFGIVIILATFEELFGNFKEPMPYDQYGNRK